VRVQHLDDGTHRIPSSCGTWVICPDTHSAPDDDPEGGIDPWAFNCLLEALGHVKPRGFIHIGDVGEWSGASHWKWSRRSRPPIQYVLSDIERDAAAVGEDLDLLDSALETAGTKDKLILLGNHDQWVINMTEELADVLDPRFKIENLLRAKQRNYTLLPYGDYARLGKLSLYHGGHYGGANFAAAHLRGLRSSVMFGHHHSVQVASASALSGGPYRAWSIGCLAKLRKPFMKGRPTNWSHAFAIVHVERDGRFHAEVIEVVGGVCYVYGKRIRG